MAAIGKSFTNSDLLFSLKEKGIKPYNSDYRNQVYTWVQNRIFPNSELSCAETRWLESFCKYFDEGAYKIWKLRRGAEDKIKLHHDGFLKKVTPVPVLDRCTCQACSPKPSASASKPDKEKRAIGEKSLKIRKEYDPQSILHAALLTLKNEGFDDANYVFKRLIESSETLVDVGKVLRAAIDDPITRPVKRTPIESTAFVLQKAIIILF